MPPEKARVEAAFDELHAEMRAQQDRRLQLAPAFLQIVAVTVTANVYLLTSEHASVAARLVVSGFSAVLIVGVQRLRIEQAVRRPC